VFRRFNIIYGGSPLKRLKNMKRYHHFSLKQRMAGMQDISKPFPSGFIATRVSTGLLKTGEDLMSQ